MKKCDRSVRVMLKRKKESSVLQFGVYDRAMGAIRIRDSSNDMEIAPSISPARLTRSMRRNIKKQSVAEIV